MNTPITLLINDFFHLLNMRLIAAIRSFPDARRWTLFSRSSGEAWKRGEIYPYLENHLYYTFIDLDER
jgi:hypothetical protein